MNSLITRGNKIFLIPLIFILVSCHSEYVSLDYKICPDACYNNDSTLVAFLATKKAFLKPKGVARFPDGGRSKIIFNKTDLYIYNVQNKKQLNVLHLDDLSLTKDNVLATPKTEISFTDSILFFRIMSENSWESQLKLAHTASDTANIEILKNLYSKPFLWEFYKQEVWQVDSAEFDSYDRTYKHVSLTEVYNFVKEVPLTDLGLNIMEIFPKSEKDYINETIYLKNDSKISRKAVVEQIIAKLSKEEIKELLLKMDNHANSLKGYEKTTYETYSAETYKQIQALL